MRRARLVATMLVLALAPIARGADGDADPKGVEFFERKIRPVLVERCYECHSADAASRKKLKGGLRLDSRDGLLQGGDSGPAVEPGNVEDSLLVLTLRHDDVVRMPPKGKLPDPVIADFETWIRMGAPDPREEAAAPIATETSSPHHGRDHWAYQPVNDPAPPEVRDASWPSNAIDRFVLARLEAQGLHPVAEADRATLARRLTFDLTGLPPSPDELAAFVADDAPDAYEKLVDRLLASPAFGERWGRHWLDVARFAESVTLRGLILKEAWRYRDYVIAAFNADRPYDRFLREQVAGDLLPASVLEESRRQRVAATFLLLGNTNLEEQDKRQLDMDVVDEQLDTIGKAILGQTIGCARCHDHKFDPIPTRDYYAMAGILSNVQVLEHANVSKWIEAPLPMPEAEEAAAQAHEAALADVDSKLKAARKTLAALSKGSEGKGPIAAKDLPGIVIDDTRARKVGAWKPSTFSGTYVGDGYVHDEDAGKGEKTITFPAEVPSAGEYEVRLAYSPGGGRATAVPVTILSADGEATVTVDMRPTPPLDGRFASLGRHRFEANGQGYVLVANDGTAGHVTADAVQFLPADADAREVAAAADPEADAAAAEAARQVKELEAELKRLKDEGPRRDLVMSVKELKEIRDTLPIHIRGSVHTLGDPVPRGFLSAAMTGESPSLPSHESGRRELGEWLSSPSNPLTARVFANRAWHWLFGAGLVRTVDNFGTTGEAPSHPELLDWLASRFVADGWSVKALVRRIVLSRTYRLAATDDPAARAADPEDRLLWRGSRRRLDAECIRDAMLTASGGLRRAMGGPGYPASLAADYGYREDDGRRGVYVPVFRNALPEIFTAFDFADPSLVVGRREASTVAPQALFLMNHPFVLDQARLTARRLLAAPDGDDDRRLDRACLLVLGRTPTDPERRLLREHLSAPDSPADRESAWSLLVQALFASADFRYID